MSGAGGRVGGSSKGSNRDEYVPPHLHPLRVGIPGRRYSRYDYVTPVADSMGRLHDRTYGTGMRRVVEREARRKERAVFNGQSLGSADFTRAVDDMSIDEYSSNVRFQQPSKDLKNALCQGCGTHNRCDIIDGGEGRMLCNKCGAVGSMYFGNDYKDTNDTEKSSARADAPRSSDSGVVRVGKPPSVETTVVPSSSKRKNKMGYAHEASTKAAEKEQKPLSKGNQRKLTNIIDCIEDLLNDMARVDDNIARKIRMDAEFIFLASLEHHSKCGKRECQKALFDKPAGVIARESLIYTIDQIASTGMDGVSTSAIVALQQRVRSSHVFNHRDNATQHQSCLAMISSLSTSDNSVVCPDAEVEDDMRSPEKCQLKHAAMGTGVPVFRQNSDVQSSPVVMMRDAIARLSVEYQCPGDVRDAAMFAMQDVDFVKKLFEEGSGFSMPKKSRSASAHVILCSIAKEAGKYDEINTDKNLRRVNLESSEVQSMVDKMVQILPKGVVGSRVVDEDELY